jgi:hypothetical protein
MDDVEVLTTIVNLLKKLDIDSQRRVLHAVHTFLGIEGPTSKASLIEKSVPHDTSKISSIGEFSKDRSLSPKEFMRDKRPNSDVERVACLAYYLAHYKDAPFFKTLDISSLNTEAAQPKFSNASVAVENATKQGYLVAASKANKQISASGEHYVELLPDRDAAREAMVSFGRKRNNKKTQAK